MNHKHLQARRRVVLTWLGGACGALAVVTVPTSNVLCARVVLVAEFVATGFGCGHHMGPLYLPTTYLRACVD